MAKKKSKKMFIKVRGSYLPNNIYGALTYIPFLAFLIVIPIWYYHWSTSIYTTITIGVIAWVIGGVVMTIIAKKLS